MLCSVLFSGYWMAIFCAMVQCWWRLDSLNREQLPVGYFCLCALPNHGEKMFPLLKWNVPSAAPYTFHMELCVMRMQSQLLSSLCNTKLLSCCWGTCPWWKKQNEEYGPIHNFISPGSLPKHHLLPNGGIILGVTQIQGKDQPALTHFIPWSLLR